MCIWHEQSYKKAHQVDQPPFLFLYSANTTKLAQLAAHQIILSRGRISLLYNRSKTMARKLYFNKGATSAGGSTTGVAVQSSTSGLTILLIFVPVLAFILYSKSKRGKSGKAEQTPEEKKQADAAKKAEEKEEKAAKKQEKKAKIYHADPEGKGIVDPAWDAWKLAHPNNPFYEAKAMPEGWTGENQVVTPVYKTMSEEERANKRGAHKPYDPTIGRILPYPHPGKEVKFTTEEDKQPYVRPCHHWALSLMPVWGAYLL